MKKDNGKVNLREEEVGEQAQLEKLNLPNNWEAMLSIWHEISSHGKE
ncbi:hypothetical protein ACIFOE_25760 [Paenibacillus sp. NRS-1783]